MSESLALLVLAAPFLILCAIWLPVEILRLTGKFDT